MAPKAKPLSRSRLPTKEEQEREEPSSEEEGDDEEGSESHSSEEEKEEFSVDTVKDEDGGLKMVKPNQDPKSDSKSVKQEKSLSDSDSDLGSPSNYKLQPISRVSRRSSSKRTHQEGDGKSQRSLRNSKKSRTEEVKSFGSSPSTPSGCIIRLWSDDDEVTVLNGMADFKNTKGLDPNADMGAFYNFIKGKLRVDFSFSKDQLKTKIRRMRKRFSNAMKKSENGEYPVFSRPHEDKAFELSKKIWGDSYIVGNGGEEEEEEEEEEGGEGGEEEEGGGGGGEVDLRPKYPFLSGSFDNLKSNIPSLGMSESGMSFAVKRLLALIGNDKAKELNGKWKQLIAEEVELNHKKLTLMKEQMKMAFDQ